MRRAANWGNGALLTLALFAFGCTQEAPPVAEQSEPAAAPTAEERLLALTDEYMALLTEVSPYLQILAGQKVTGLPDNPYAGTVQYTERVQDILQRLGEVDPDVLEHDDYLTYAMFRDMLQAAVEAQQYFWHGFNITPYAVGSSASMVLPVVLGTSTFESDEDIDYYLDFLSDIARYFSDDLTRIAGQEERDILLPQGALPGARTAISGVGDMTRALTVISPERMTELDETQRERLTSGIDEILNSEIQPAIDALLDYIGEGYEGRAPVAVGLGQYPGGDEAYRYAIRRQTTMDLDPQEIHDQGLAYMATLQERMAEIRADMGFEGTQAEFHEQMRSNPRFYAETPEEVEETYMAYIRRIEPLIGDYFSVMPKAPYGVKRLEPAQEPGLTFGLYQPPSPTEPVGNYRYNGSKLESRPLIWAAALIYHELIPGHHFHIALQREREGISEFRRTTSLMYAAFTEGWANYAASLAGEMGLLDDPWDQYGWLLFDAFITNRLVVDTGMNYLGWSLEQAREYMLANTFSSAEEVATETLRYSTDMPAQALAYKLGFEKIRTIRKTHEERLGNAFDIKAFHAATVGSGGLPLPLLELHVDWYMNELNVSANYD